MFIDLHCHTKKAKSGDEGREVDSKTFRQKVVTDNQVGLLAITNHNMFDRSQFDQFTAECKGEVVILPGIELDVYGDKSGKRHSGHVLVIADNKRVDSFQNFVDELCGGTDPNDFEIKIDDFVSKLDQCLEKFLVIFHYKKSPELTMEDISFFKTNCSNGVVILEPSNSRKASIIINCNNERTWFGSDNHDWANYPGKELPDCLFEIKCFEQLFALLAKEQNAVLLNTLMSPKKAKQYMIDPFGDGAFTLQLYNDVNVFFGSKATGKTMILKCLEDELVKEQKSVGKFYIEDKSEGLSNLVGYKPTDDDLRFFGAFGCENDIKTVKNWTWTPINPLKDFYDYALMIQGNQLAERLKITNASFSEVLLKDGLKSLENETDNALESISKVFNLQKMGLTEEETKTLSLLLRKLADNYIKSYVDSFIKFKAGELTKKTISFFKTEISKNIGTKKKPDSVGLSSLFSDRHRLGKALNTINECLGKENVLGERSLGKLQSKGCVYRSVRIGIAPQAVPKNGIKGVSATRMYLERDATQKEYEELKKAIARVLKSKMGTKDSSEVLESLKQSLGSVNSLRHFLNYTIWLRNGTNEDFRPSNGEASVLLVDSVLHNGDYDAIILDEPDSGMGADFVNDVLVPDIIDAAKRGKIVLLSTHDPNLVVRTHSYLSVFRDKTDADEYKTYVGSVFEDKMVNIMDKTDTVAWVEKCIQKCEGGEVAITERERTYGHY